MGMDVIQGDRLWRQIYYGRPLDGGGGSASVSSLSGAGSSNLALGFHLVVIDQPLRIRGYHFQGKSISSADWRLWLIRSHAQTCLPYGPAITNSDTFKRTAGDTNADRTRDKIGTPQVWGPTGTSTTRYVDFLLPNVVEIDRPGIYYIGAARSNVLTMGETYYGSWLAGYSRGVRDMMSTETVANSSIGSFDPATLTDLNLANQLKDQKFKFPSEDPSGQVYICNIDFGLITERWFDG